MRLGGLYLVTDDRLGDGLEAAVAAALRGGARLVQYRGKHGDVARRAAEAQGLRRVTRRFGVPLIVNDDPLLAAEVEADGVHLGREDPDPGAARSLLGARALVGVSCYADLARARAAAAGGADYVAFGSVYPSPTKPAAVRAPLELLSAARRELDASVAVCAIGGITAERAAGLAAAGADLLAVVSAVLLAADVEAAARAIAVRIGKVAPQPPGRPT